MTDSLEDSGELNWQIISHTPDLAIHLARSPPRHQTEDTLALFTQLLDNLFLHLLLSFFGLLIKAQGVILEYASMDFEV